ncbi:FAD-dependent oxidoreductase [Nocardia pseudovaccinii]|uniref:FAD-dependent oxidoreductase n=1 Tax=Nocardia pseudovaccinii TaxID=189540 RepID=UPI003D8BB9A4
MSHVVTESCCNDASCVYACPVNCIHPTPDEADYHTAEMLYIDPAACVDCGACVAACPVGAIKPHTELDDSQQVFLSVNAEFYRKPRSRPLLAPFVPPLTVSTRHAPLRVAIVGSGPAGMYTAEELLTVADVRVDLFERLDAPYGLARFGVAPDHREVRKILRLFDRIRDDPRVRVLCGVEIGRDRTYADLAAAYDAVVYAVGAVGRRLDIPGGASAGVASAPDFAAWYNGHPALKNRVFDLWHPRVVIIGNGNVALDVARILVTDPQRLASTSISPYALDTLRRSGVEEVVVVGRRGPADAAYTLPELIGLQSNSEVDFVVAAEELAREQHPDARVELLREVSARSEPSRGDRPRRIVLRHHLSPTRITHTGQISHVEFRRTGPTAAEQVESISAGLILTAIGHHGRSVAGVPFDHAAGVVPNEHGRVVDPAHRRIVTGTYVVGWIKRGPTGFIGTNKTCAQETVRALIDDYNAGKLTGAARELTV